MCDVTPLRHAQGTLSILRASVACAVVVQTAVLVLCCLARPVGGTAGPCRGVLLRTNARCDVDQ